MVAPDLSPEVIASRIKAAYAAKKAAVEAGGTPYGIRTAAKNIVARTDAGTGINVVSSVESWRKQIGRILGAREVKPHESTRRLLAEEFECDPAHFGVSDGVSVVGGGTHYAALFEALAEQEKATKKLQRQVALFMERMEGVAA